MSSNHPDIWLSPPNRYNLVPTATSDEADLGGGIIPVTSGWDHFNVSDERKPSSNDHLS